VSPAKRAISNIVPASDVKIRYTIVSSTDVLSEIRTTVEKTANRNDHTATDTRLRNERTSKWPTSKQSATNPTPENANPTTVQRPGL
jgi:hypothetical protein